MRPGLYKVRLSDAASSCQWWNVTHGLSVISYRAVQCAFEMFYVEEIVHFQYLHKICVMEKMPSKVL
jgi:hypothetical protein